MSFLFNMSMLQAPIDLQTINSHLASMIRIIPKKTYMGIYGYYRGEYRKNPKRIEQIPRIHRIMNHITSVFLPPTPIFDGLYLGNAYNASNWSTVTGLGIRYIMNVSVELDNYFENVPLDTSVPTTTAVSVRPFQENYIKYMRVPIEDDCDAHLSEYVDDIVAFMDAVPKPWSKNPVLVHCYMGSSRSASVVLLYMTMRMGYNVEDAIAYLREKRPIVNINNNFVEDVYQVDLLSR